MKHDEVDNAFSFSLVNDESLHVHLHFKPLIRLKKLIVACMHVYHESLLLAVAYDEGDGISPLNLVDDKSLHVHCHFQVLTRIKLIS